MLVVSTLAACLVDTEEVEDVSVDGGSERWAEEERDEAEEAEGEDGKDSELNLPVKKVVRMSCW